MSADYRGPAGRCMVGVTSPVLILPRKSAVIYESWITLNKHTLEISELVPRIMPWQASSTFSPIKFFFPWRDSPSGPRPPHYRGFMITLRHTTLGRTPVDEWSARRRDLYLNTQNTHKRQIFMPPSWYSNPQSQLTSALDRAANENCDSLFSHNFPFRRCIFWATDSFYSVSWCPNRKHFVA
jgi:hypothetical protein